MFKYGKALMEMKGNRAEIVSYKPNESVVFAVDLDVEGDIIVIIRHINKDGARIAMLKFVCQEIADLPNIAQIAQVGIAAFNGRRSIPDLFATTT